MGKGKKVLRWSIIILLSLVFILFITVKIFIKTKLPDIDGTIEISSLAESATVIRDRWGVPHITAKNGRDAFFVYGYTIAQDRLFQMDIQRHLARGDLALLLGKSLVDIDKKHRTLMFRHASEKFFSRIDEINPEALALFDAFLAGVNHFIQKGDLPLEYALLGVTPRPFTREDCGSMFGYMAFSFAEGFDSDSLYSMLQKDLPDRDVSELFPLYSRETPVTVMETQADYEEGKGLSNNGLIESGVKYIGQLLSPEGSVWSALASPRELAYRIAPPFQGSNSWVIGPSRTATGGAILASDPHIALSNPAVWYEAHIKFEGYETYGCHMPLMPFPLISHNQYRATGITMFENDDLDLYEETLSPDGDKVLYRGNWVAVQTIEETIKVKNGPDVKFSVRVTPHGPIVTDFIENYKGKPLAMCWVYLKEKSPLLDVFYGMSVAKTADEFGRALAPLAAPGLNYTFADKDGNIAWWAAGKVVVRPPKLKGDHILDGASGRDEWLGYLPFAQNPHLLNPKSGVIVSANNLSTTQPLGAAGELQGYWTPTDRAARITKLLASKEKWSVKDVMAVQTDLTPIAADDMIAIAAEEVEKSDNGAKALTAVERKALDTLKSWDRKSVITSAGAAVYHTLMYHIMKEGIADELGPERFKTYLTLHGNWSFLKAFLKNPGSAFWDDTKTPEKEGRSAIVRRAFTAAVAMLGEKMGTNVDSWQWGRIHTIEYVHPVGMQKPMNLLFNIGPLPAPGEAHHINRLKSKLVDGLFQVYSVPSTRRLIDMKNPGGSFYILPSGNSGNVGSENYDDQVGMYLAGEYRPVYFIDTMIKENTAHTLVFVPKGK